MSMRLMIMAIPITSSCPTRPEKDCQTIAATGRKYQPDKLGWEYCLHYCFAYSFESLGDYFIKKGADDSVANAEGLTCYEGLSQDSVNNI